LFAPVTSRGEAVGVLELGLENFPLEQTVADVALAAHFLAYVVIANRRYTDLFEWGQRSVPLSLAAEIQHRLLPGAFTCEAGQFTLAAWLQPAGEIGGDTFDFSLERDTLHLSLTDAMGHTMDAALLATVLVGGLRNARRRGVELAKQARLANDALAEQAGESQFVTGLLVRIDLARASAGIVNAGHPPPLRLRSGQIERVHLEADRPFGLAGRRPLSGASAAVGGRRPADVRHRRHAGARRRGHEHRRHPDRGQHHACPRGRAAPHPGGPPGKRWPATRRRHGAVSRLARRPSPGP
jgi:Stage II sporulation protein E (SpoIIE)